MLRSMIAAAVVLTLTTAVPAAEPLKLGASAQIEFTDKLPKGDPTNNSAFVWIIAFDYPIEQGDRFRIEMEPVGGVEMALSAGLARDLGNNTFGQTEFSGGGAKIDWTNTKGLTGKQARVFLYSKDLGKVNVRITKVGSEASGDPKDAEIKKLKDENATLKKDLAEMKQQLADIKKLLEKKQP